MTIMALMFVAGNAAAQSWPVTAIEAKPGARWWWLGSAVNEIGRAHV